MAYRKVLNRLDNKLIEFMRKAFFPTARFAIFLIYFWFGILKVIGPSAANPLVLSLLAETMPAIEPTTFLIWFGVFEMFIGVAFLIPRWGRIALALLFLHMFTTILPLFILPEMAWQSAFVPTLEGQYIIKNIVIITLALGIGSHLHLRKTDC